MASTVEGLLAGAAQRRPVGTQMVRPVESVSTVIATP
jgi:hypothetical protein